MIQLLNTKGNRPRTEANMWYSKMGTHSSARIIEDVDLTLKALEIVYRANDDAVEGLSDRTEHIYKEVGEGKSFNWRGARTKGEGRECELTKNMFFYSDLLKLCLRGKQKIAEFFPDTTAFTIKELALQTK